MFGVIDFAKFNDVLFRALTTLAFFGFLRVGEYLAPGGTFRPDKHLTVGDLS